VIHYALTSALSTTYPDFSEMYSRRAESGAEGQSSTESDARGKRFRSDASEPRGDASIENSAEHRPIYMYACGPVRTPARMEPRAAWASRAACAGAPRLRSVHHAGEAPFADLHERAVDLLGREVEVVRFNWHTVDLHAPAVYGASPL
jgi:hypothetical protein